MITETLTGGDSHTMALAASSIGITISHAGKHGTDALMVQQCLINKGHSSLWVNPYNDHYIRVCDLDDGRVGIQVIKKILGKWEEITSFIPRHSGDFEKYLVNSGAELVWDKEKILPIKASFS